MTYSNQSLVLGRRDVALGVHVHDGSGAAARRPRDNIGARLEREGTFLRPGQGQRVVRLALDAGEVERVGAETLGALGNLSETAHIRGQGGEPMGMV